MSELSGAVNILAIPPVPQLADLGVACVSYGGLLNHDLMERFTRLLREQPSTDPLEP